MFFIKAAAYENKVGIKLVHSRGASIKFDGVSHIFAAYVFPENIISGLYHLHIDHTHPLPWTYFRV